MARRFLGEELSLNVAICAATGPLLTKIGCWLGGLRIFAKLSTWLRW
ncbi:MAG: hypothetical protein QXH86_09230 [Ignisphaera sp.]